MTIDTAPPDEKPLDASTCKHKSIYPSPILITQHHKGTTQQARPTVPKITIDDLQIHHPLTLLTPDSHEDKHVKFIETDPKKDSASTIAGSPVPHSKPMEKEKEGAGLKRNKSFKEKCLDLVHRAPSAHSLFGSDHDRHSAHPTTPATSTYGNHECSLKERYGKASKIIGKGAGGVVRLVCKNETFDLRSAKVRDNKLYAVKEFRKQRTSESRRDYMKKVTNEFCIGSMMEHENVLKTLDLIFDQNKVYEIMEYCPHVLLNVLQEQPSISPEVVGCWFKQLLCGIEYLHSLGIAHRDLKLENCLVTDDGVLKIIDFGCATVFRSPFAQTEAIELSTKVCGSDPYIAPEVFANKTYDPRKSDVWSAGIIFLTMLMHGFLWKIAKPECDRSFKLFTVKRHQFFNKVPIPESVDVLAHMLELNPEKRFLVKELLLNEWVTGIERCSTACPAAGHIHTF